MTARLFGFHSRLPASFAAIDNAARLLSCIGKLARRLMRLTAGAGRRVVERRRLSHLDDRTLNDIGLRPDDFARVARERLQDWIMRYHI